VTLRFEPNEYDELLLRNPSNKGLVILDARRDPRSNEVSIRVSVCRRQPLCVEGVDPEGAYEVQVDDEPVLQVGVRTVRTIQARLAKKTDAAVQPTRRTYTPGTTRFLDLEIQGEDNNFVERTIRIRQIPEPAASKAKAALVAAIPAKRGRVT
jgi:hypothetical protein